MDELQNNDSRPVNPRRRRRSRMDIFKESYLPVIIAGFTLVFVLVTIIGSAVQNSERKRLQEEAEIKASIAAQEEEKRLNEESARLLQQAAEYAATHNYDHAIQSLRSFSGNIEDFPQLSAALQQYTDIKSNMVLWDDPSKVLNLSFQLLIADPIRAFADENYGRAYNRNFVTTEEFRLILDQLYRNGYVLVSLDDIVTTSETEDGSVFAAKELYLPAGKKPLILTQTHVNYNIFMTDGDGDKLPDKDGAGFASKLVTENGKLVNQYVDRDGSVVTGEYDLIPILNSFIQSHPGFSYHGAKAIIAVTGYDGLFGYRTNPGAKEWLGTDAYNQEVESAKRIAQAIRDDGYDIACYTYENVGYGDIGLTQMQYDLKRWNDEVVPILGTVDIMAFAQISDIGDQAPYTGEKFTELMNAGFRYYLGFCQNGALWADTQPNYFRQARILVTGSNLKYNSQWFNGILDPVQILSSTRGDIPQ